MLSKIENRILEIKGMLSDERRKKELSRLVSMEVYEKRLKKENEPLIAELEKLSVERQFILDRRNNIFWKFIWNVTVPILVTIITTYIISRFMR